MSFPKFGFHESITPSQAEVFLAQESCQRLVSFLEEQKDLPIQMMKEGNQPEEIVLPASVLRLLVNVLVEIANGNGVTLVSQYAEFTTQQAADFLNVSRPFIVRLIDEGKIPARKVGTHRRILFDDLKKYKEKNQEERLKVLDQLTEQAQDLDMGY